MHWDIPMMPNLKSLVYTEAITQPKLLIFPVSQFETRTHTHSLAENKHSKCSRWKQIKTRHSGPALASWKGCSAPHLIQKCPHHRALCLWGEKAFKYSGETGLYYLSPSSSGPAQSKCSMSVQLLSEPAPLQRLISAEDLAWYFPSKGQQRRRVKLRKKKPHKTPNKQSRTNKWN